MNEEDYKKVFSNRLKFYMDKYGKNQMDLMKDLGLSSSTVSNWCTGLKLPRMNKIQMLADYFGVNKSDLIEEPPVEEIQDELFEKRKLLFDMSAKASPEDLEKIIKIVNTLVGDDND